MTFDCNLSGKTFGCSLYMGVTYKNVGKFSTFYRNNLSYWLGIDMARREKL